MDDTKRHPNFAVFHDGGEFWWSRYLKRGYRHCFAAINTGEYWIISDWIYGEVFHDVVANADYDLETSYNEAGMATAQVPQHWLASYTPFVVRSCVGHVKLTLDIASLAQTPWQLYRSLKR